MGKWELAEAKKDFARGVFTGYQIQDATPLLSSDRRWSIYFNVRIGEGGILVPQRGDGPRTFNTLDAVVSTLRDIGFRVQALEGR